MNKEKEKIVNLKLSELKKSLTEARLKLAQLKLDWQAGKLDRRSEIVKRKRKIALLLTLIKQKETKGEEK